MLTCKVLGLEVPVPKGLSICRERVDIQETEATLSRVGLLPAEKEGWKDASVPAVVEQTEPVSSISGTMSTRWKARLQTKSPLQRRE